eukprot:1194433-Prorocentrum_minimum.AAC.8
MMFCITNYNPRHQYVGSYQLLKLSGILGSGIPALGDQFITPLERGRSGTPGPEGRGGGSVAGAQKIVGGA